MIQDVDESLRALVKRDALNGSKADIAFDAPNREWSSRRNTPTVDLYLYDIREDLEQREVMWEDIRGDTRDSRLITERRPPPRRFKLSYLVTAWTQRPEDEHRLLSALLACFLRNQTMPADVLRKAGDRPQLIVGDPDKISAETLRCGAQVVLPADADGHAAGLERIQDLGVGAMTFPAAGSAADLALLLCDHHGASLIVTVGHTASIEEFFDRSRQQSNPSTFLTRLKVGDKLVDAKAVATLYRSRVSGGAIALLVLAMLIAVIVAL